jgi:hypothetical protein
MSALSASAALQWLIQGPLLIVASICGGLLGSAFNMLKRRNRFWRQQHPGIAWRLLEGAGVALITATALVMLPAVAGTCLQVRRRCWFVRAGCEATEIVRQHLYCSSIILFHFSTLPSSASALQTPEQWDEAEVFRGSCPEGQYNDLSTGLLGSGVWVIRSLLSLGSESEPVNNQVCCPRGCCNAPCCSAAAGIRN